MAGSLNKAQIIGNVGSAPEIRSMQNGERVATLSIATSETWKDKAGERQEKTQWHRVVTFNQNIVNVIEKYVSKGSKLYVEGSIETRKWDKDGVPQYSTEIVLKPFNGVLTLLDSKGGTKDQDTSSSEPVSAVEDDSDSIPF